MDSSYLHNRRRKWTVTPLSRWGNWALARSAGARLRNPASPTPEPNSSLRELPPSSGSLSPSWNSENTLRTDSAPTWPQTGAGAGTGTPVVSQTLTLNCWPEQRRRSAWRLAKNPETFHPLLLGIYIGVILMNKNIDNNYQNYRKFDTTIHDIFFRYAYTS